MENFKNINNCVEKNCDCNINKNNYNYSENTGKNSAKFSENNADFNAKNHVLSHSIASGGGGVFSL